MTVAALIMHSDDVARFNETFFIKSHADFLGPLYIKRYFSQAIQVLRAETGKLSGHRRTLPEL
jgi:hypothetical protein